MRSTRSTIMLGAATAVALVTATWLGAGAAVADTPTPDPSGTGAPADPYAGTDTPSTNPLADAPPAPAAGTDHHRPPTPGTIPKALHDVLASGVQTGNSFSSPISLTGRYPFVQLDNTNATVQGGEPRILQGNYYLSRTQWLKWKPASTGTVYIQVYGDTTSQDVGINVYKGTSLTHLTRIASNDQQNLPPDGGATISSGSANTAGILSLDVTAGKIYYLQVGTATSTAATVGAALTNISVVVYGNYHPSNDNINHAKVLTLGPGATVTTTGVLGGAGVEVWEDPTNPENAAAPIVSTIWYKWIAPQDGTATFSNCALFDLGPSINVFSESLGTYGKYYGDLEHRGFDTGGYSGCTLILGGGIISIPVTKGAPYWIQSGETLGSIPRDVNTQISATFSKPFINGLNHTSGKAGNTIVITGQSLTTGGTPVVKFGTKTATIVGAPTATSITVKVPSQSKKGKFTVTITAGVNVSNVSSFTYK